MDPSHTRTNRSSIVARARAVEDLIAQHRAKQYVIRGAGLDTYAQRHDNSIDVFEVDTPSAQAWKRQRLDQLGWPTPNRLHFVPVDFEADQSWLEQVTTAGLNPHTTTVVSMLGVSMYLTQSAIAATLEQAATLAAGSVLVFSYSRPIDQAPPPIQPILRQAARGAAASGHPWISLLRPDQAIELARQGGFGDVELVTSFDLHDRYFAGRPDGLSPAGGEDLIVATVTGAA
jgi:methyltransferase (TIGR00027 family)